jgi:hypothetical protein
VQYVAAASQNFTWPGETDPPGELTAAALTEAVKVTAVVAGTVLTPDPADVIESAVNVEAGAAHAPRVAAKLKITTNVRNRAPKRDMRLGIDTGRKPAEPLGNFSSMAGPLDWGQNHHS